ncbi:MAG: hypothetical protein P8J37_15710 [Fuerstiella sp.]|nr:hypothetical protein [Fuerstiella sp.]
MTTSLCEFCSHTKDVVSAKGSRFLLCGKAATDNRFQKYPPQPVVQCGGFEQKKEEKISE